MCDIVICVHRGQSAPDAEKNYLDNAKLLAFYGVDFHHATVCTISLYCDVLSLGWLCDTVVERRSFTGELSLSCARPAADG